jgi:polyribonucleotide nucleotidyltransferase
MFTIHREEIEWGGRTLVLETGRVARQADGAVLATYGETVVLATAVGAGEPKVGIDFFPLTVNYQEKFYAAGKIPGGYFRREGRPTERETLISRLIDRPIRPLFAPGYRNETQVIITVLSHDLENDPDIVAMIASSAALTISGIPFLGPIGAARVGYVDGEYKLNPETDGTVLSLDLVVAGTSDAVLMVESEAKELREEIMLGAVMFGHREMQVAIDAIIRLAEKAAKEPREVVEEDYSKEEAELANACENEIKAAYQIAEKGVRQDRIAEIKKNGNRGTGRRGRRKDRANYVRQTFQETRKPRDAVGNA